MTTGRINQIAFVAAPTIPTRTTRIEHAGFDESWPRDGANEPHPSVAVLLNPLSLGLRRESERASRNRTDCLPTPWRLLRDRRPAREDDRERVKRRQATLNGRVPSVRVNRRPQQNKLLWRRMSSRIAGFE